MRPNLWALVYAFRAVSPGYCVPCIYALLRGGIQGAYATIWGDMRDLACEDADRERRLAVAFGRAN